MDRATSYDLKSVADEIWERHYDSISRGNPDLPADQAVDATNAVVLALARELVAHDRREAAVARASRSAGRAPSAARPFELWLAA